MIFNEKPTTPSGNLWTSMKNKQNPEENNDLQWATKIP